MTPFSPSSLRRATRRVAAVALLLGLALGTAQAQATHDHASHEPPANATATPATPATPGTTAPDAAEPWVDGEVRRWDPHTGKLTLRHGAIANLAMPAMTMVFQLHPRLQATADLQPGQRVRFQAERQGGALVVTQLHAL
ncbi:hypothetical protein CCO03_02785 [Comamonas serinivorans]|uniref:Copper-binding protein n=1 Tax=Comamonas serinivorans TaxID=1082851 RepID=A0A1Y0ESE8_9BURK|nr:copper-binding protein [Comamonas serinivorans]ARU06605.1 hypothetical protein CCO03_02785 [Comamonas serinivorans]